MRTREAEPSWRSPTPENACCGSLLRPGAAHVAAHRGGGGFLDECLEDRCHRQASTLIAALRSTVGGNVRGYRCQLPVPVTAARDSFRCPEGV